MPSLQTSGLGQTRFSVPQLPSPLFSAKRSSALRGRPTHTRRSTLALSAFPCLRPCKTLSFAQTIPTPCPSRNPRCPHPQHAFAGMTSLPNTGAPPSPPNAARAYWPHVQTLSPTTTTIRQPRCRAGQPPRADVAHARGTRAGGLRPCTRVSIPRQPRYRPNHARPPHRPRRRHRAFGTTRPRARSTFTPLNCGR